MSNVYLVYLILRILFYFGLSPYLQTSFPFTVGAQTSHTPTRLSAPDSPSLLPPAATGRISSRHETTSSLTNTPCVRLTEYKVLRGRRQGGREGRPRLKGRPVVGHAQRQERLRKGVTVRPATQQSPSGDSESVLHLSGERSVPPSTCPVPHLEET